MVSIVQELAVSFVRFQVISLELAQKFTRLDLIIGTMVERKYTIQKKYLVIIKILLDKKTYMKLSYTHFAAHLLKAVTLH